MLSLGGPTFKKKDLKWRHACYSLNIPHKLLAHGWCILRSANSCYAAFWLVVICFLPFSPFASFCIILIQKVGKWRKTLYPVFWFTPKSWFSIVWIRTVRNYTFSDYFFWGGGRGLERPVLVRKKACFIVKKQACFLNIKLIYYSALSFFTIRCSRYGTPT